MHLSELINGDRLGAQPDVDIRGLTADSREVRPGFLFAALRGTREDGADFVADAIAKGAAAVLAAPGAAGGPVPIIPDDNPRRALARFAARFYHAQPATVAAVTGTNGKTSVVDFLRQIWRIAGHRAASLGTLGVVAPDSRVALGHTTPDPVKLHRCLAELAADGVDHLALEASSHGLDQFRLDGVAIGAAAFTNLSRDHLDYHADPESYFRAKARLFQEVMAPAGRAVLNAGSDATPRLTEMCRARGHQVLTYGAVAGADLRLVGRRPIAAGQALELEIEGRAQTATLALPGAFQAENAVAALGLALATGVAAEAALSAIAQLRGVPGRLQLAGRRANGAAVYVDYAHTPDALRHVLLSLGPHTAGRLHVVFGCGGDRDRGKRAQMGTLAAELADHAWVTDDNPRTEDPAAIRAEILAACPAAREIGDRRTAIHAAVAGLAAGDVLVIAGKGHEQGQIVGAEIRRFDDVAEARAAIASADHGDGS